MNKDDKRKLKQVNRAEDFLKNTEGGTKGDKGLLKYRRKIASETIDKNLSEMKDYNVPSTKGKKKLKARIRRKKGAKTVGEAFGTSPHKSSETGKSRKKKHDEAVRGKEKKKKRLTSKKRRGGSISYSSGSVRSYSKKYPGMGG